MKEVHEELMSLFREYFRLNLEWETKRTHASGMRVRKALSEIRRLATDRRQEIQDIRAEKPKVKSPAYRQSKLKDQNNSSDT